MDTLPMPVLPTNFDKKFLLVTESSWTGISANSLVWVAYGDFGVQVTSEANLLLINDKNATCREYSVTKSQKVRPTWATVLSIISLFVFWPGIFFFFYKNEEYYDDLYLEITHGTGRFCGMVMT